MWRLLSPGNRCRRKHILSFRSVSLSLFLSYSHSLWLTLFDRDSLTIWFLGAQTFREREKEKLIQWCTTVSPYSTKWYTMQRYWITTQFLHLFLHWERTVEEKRIERKEERKRGVMEGKDEIECKEGRSKRDIYWSWHPLLSFPSLCFFIIFSSSSPSFLRGKERE